MNKRFLLLAGVLAVVFFAAEIWANDAPAAGDWTQFRGPAGTGIASGATAPSTWGKEKGVLWKAPIPGGGWSSPVVAGDRVFVTTAYSDPAERPKNFTDGVKDMRSFMVGGPSKGPDKVYRFEVRALDRATGREVWKRTVAEKKPPYPIHPSNTYATESPATDGARLYVYFAPVGLLAALTRDGQPVWSHDLGAKKVGNGFGSGSSLALADGRLFVQCDNEEKSYLAAFDAPTGKELWRADRPGKTSWSTPLVWRNKQRTEVIACGSGRVTAYEPATGQLLWELTGVGGTFTASPAADEGRLYLGNSGPMSVGPLVAVAAGAKGELKVPSAKEAEKGGGAEAAGVRWVKPRSAPGMPSPLAYGGHLYILGQVGLACYDTRTGELCYRERLPKSRQFAASLWAADGKVYCLDESGQTFVVKAGPKFELLGVNTLEGTFWSTPALAGDSLFLRAADGLYCVRP